MRDLYEDFVNECSKAEEAFRDVVASAYADRGNRINKAANVMFEFMSDRIALFNGSPPTTPPKTLKHEEQPGKDRQERYPTRDEIEQAKKQARLKRLNEEQAMQSHAGTVGIVALENEFRANRIE